MRLRAQVPPPQPPMVVGSSTRPSGSPRMPPESAFPDAAASCRCRAALKDKNTELNSSSEQLKKECRKRAPRRVGGKEDTPTSDPQYWGPVQLQQAPPFKVSATNESPEPMSSNGTGSSQRSLQPLPANSTHGPPLRKLDEDYDGDAAETLVNMHSYQQDPRFPPPPPGPGSMRSPTVRGSLSKYPSLMGCPRTPGSK